MVQVVYLTIKNLQVPIGGVIVQGQHVAALKRAGFDTKIASTFEGPRPDWIDSDAPFVDGNRLKAQRGDVLVLHDSVPRHLFDRFMTFPLRRVFFCQNHHFLHGTLRPGERLCDFPIEAFMCVSEPIAELLRRVHGVANPVIIRPAIAPAQSVQEKKLQVCYMPRKRPAAFDVIHKRFIERYPELGSTAFVVIQDMHPVEVAEVMAESAVFLSFSAFEGLGLPPLEAMAAGCVVVGYHGGGGLDYATDANGRWYDEATPDNLADLLADTVQQLIRDPDAFAPMIRNGLETAARYSRAAMEQDLLRFWRGFL